MIKHKAFASTPVMALMLGATFVTSGNAMADFVIPDDLIVQGSACVGLDCVDGESFGFDTIRLKENNTRIKFDDTSTSAGFPNNDWQLTANDSASGGLNKFSIENTTVGTIPFTVFGPAPTNSLFVSSTGRVGLRTATPGLDIHISTSDTPAERLEQTAAGGFAAQTWDIGGNEANFFVRDVTGGSRLPFRIRPGAPTSSIDINASGNVGVGTASPQGKLHLQASSQLASVWGDSSGTLGNKIGRLVYDGGNAVAGGGWVFQKATDAGVFVSNLFTIIQNTGNVGIGTITPAVQLHTTGAVRFAGVANCGSGIQSNASGDLSCLVSSRQFKNIAGELPPKVALANVWPRRGSTAISIPRWAEPAPRCCPISTITGKSRW
jgi:hypothetical protein